MAKGLKQVIADVLGMEPAAVADDLSMQTAEKWDSLKHMEIVASLEDEFEITFTADQIVEITSLPLIRQALEQTGVEA